MASQVRQNYPSDCEAAISRMDNMESTSSYTYVSMSRHFRRDDVALEGFAKFFKEQSDEGNENAEELREFQNKRGGRTFRQENIKKPEKDEWGPVVLMQCRPL
ncbi:ferritin, spleen middle subunit-like [Polypterus senegalus]|uniref:ferritin, spleen middle subunit-like n=1 Tax=Polypterus senegalus TaxID=55291 RepID=UPI0019623C7E|nr:ferritin, spleen middle subunit-like [Polypterus senegalus]